MILERIVVRSKLRDGHEAVHTEFGQETDGALRGVRSHADEHERIVVGRREGEALHDFVDGRLRQIKRARVGRVSGGRIDDTLENPKLAAVYADVDIRAWVVALELLGDVRHFGPRQSRAVVAEIQFVEIELVSVHGGVCVANGRPFKARDGAVVVCVVAELRERVVELGFGVDAGHVVPRAQEVDVGSRHDPSRQRGVDVGTRYAIVALEQVGDVAVHGRISAVFGVVIDENGADLGEIVLGVRHTRGLERARQTGGDQAGKDADDGDDDEQFDEGEASGQALGTHLRTSGRANVSYWCSLSERGNSGNANPLQRKGFLRSIGAFHGFLRGKVSGPHRHTCNTHVSSRRQT